MIGIYKIQNKENGKIYIGQSNDIERRLKEHCYPSRRLSSGSPIDEAIYKYGKKAFTFDIVEECSLEELNQKETYWIRYYKAYPEGYNCNEGGEQQSIGEQNPNAKISEIDVIAIRKIYGAQGKKKDAYKIVKDRTSWTNFESIWQGKTWSHIMPEVYTPENKKYYSVGRNAVNNNAYTDEEIMAFRQKYVNHSAREVYETSDKRITYTSFQKLLNGTSCDYLPYYMKKIKKWIQPDEEKPKICANRGLCKKTKSIFTDEQVMLFRQEYITSTAKQIYENNQLKEIISFSCFQKILTGANYKHLPYFSKKTQSWIQPEPVSTIFGSEE